MTAGVDLHRLRGELRTRPLTVADYVRLGREINRATDLDGLLPLRIAILSTCTMEFIDPYLRVEGTARGLHLQTHFGPFGQLEQQLGDPGSPLYAFSPDVVLIVLRPEDIDPDAFVRYHGSSAPSAIDAAVERASQCAKLLRERSSAPLLVANFAPPAYPPLGLFDANSGASLTLALARACDSLRANLSAIPGAAVWDYAGLVRSQGTASWCDPRLWALARVPVASRHQVALAIHLARSVAALIRAPAKCLVLDLDNTLWGGVIGDDGLEGIQVGDDYPGSVFKSFQRAALGLADRGILLAVVSKNDSDIAVNALQRHPEMLIRMEHLSAFRINWTPKSRNLREIAEELNIGMDALVHFDDNPAERAEIAANAPAVLLVDVPSDPLGYEAALHDCGFFDAAVLSDEDRKRAQMYRQDRAREVSRSSAGTVEGYLDDLEMVAEIGRVDDRNLSRVAQLIGKTNQFNLTTRRHPQAEIARMARGPGHSVTYLRLRDRFGDLGLIAVGIIAFDGTDALIDSFVMSCRAMGRGAETALLAELTSAARDRGCARLVGEYFPTARNGIVSTFYNSAGFREEPESPGGTRYSLDLAADDVRWPSAIRREVPSARGGVDA